MKLWPWSREDKLEQHHRLVQELLEKSEEMVVVAKAQRQALELQANGHLVEFQEALGGVKDAGKSGTEL